ncbi:MAG: hypothetical protein PHW76_08135 [Alphaproteobacteria bacterium]|nr:hypothetical protein [Alphaproteobacteria bacterium]
MQTLKKSLGRFSNEFYLAGLRLSYSRFGDRSEIDVFVERTRRWETVATIYSVDKFDAEEIAEMIFRRIGNRTVLNGKNS